MRHDSYKHLISGAFSHLFDRRFQFQPGDQPSATTLSAWATQDAYSIDILENIVGDLRGAEHLGRLYFTNLSRVCGNAALISSWMPTIWTGGSDNLPRSFVVTQPIPSGITEYDLAFIPDWRVWNSAKIFVLGNDGILHEIASYLPKPDRPGLLDQYDFYSESGKLIFKSKLEVPSTYFNGTQWFIRYWGLAYDSMGLDGMDNTLIPTFAQCLRGELCSIEEATPGSLAADGYREYLLYLPEIKYLLHRNDISQYAPLGSTADIAVALSKEAKYQTFAIESQSLRYELPKWLTEDIVTVDGTTNGFLSSVTLEEGQDIGTDPANPAALFPSGTIILWNFETDEPASYLTESDTSGVYEIQFVYVDFQTIKVRIPGGARLITSISGGTINYVPDDGSTDTSTFCLILKGSDLSQEVFNLKSTLKFRPSALQFGASWSHRAMKNTFRALDYTNLNQIGQNGYFQSAINDNQHPQYLERVGYVPGSDPLNRDNALLGDQCIAGDGNTYGASLGPAVGTDAEIYGSYRKYWSGQYGLFNQYRFCGGGWTFNGTSIVHYQTMHNGSEKTWANIFPTYTWSAGHHARYDRGSFGQYHSFWNLSAGPQVARGDHPLTSDDNRLTFWKIGNDTAPASLRGLPLNSQALELTKGYNNQATTANGYFVGRGHRWIDLSGGLEAGGWSTCDGSVPSYIQGCGYAANTGKLITGFDINTFATSTSSTDGVPYLSGQLQAGKYSAFAWYLADILFTPGPSVNRIQFGKFVFPGAAFGITNLGYTGEHKCFGVFDKLFNGTTDPGDLAWYDIQMLGHWAFRGNISGGGYAKQGAYRSHWLVSPELFFVGDAESAFGALSFSDAYRPTGTWENLADWRMSPTGDLNTKGEITIRKSIKARYFVGEASRVQRPIIQGNATDIYSGVLQAQPVIKETVCLINVTTGPLDQIWYGFDYSYLVAPPAWKGNINCLWLPIEIKCTWLLASNSTIKADLGGSGSSHTIQQFTVNGAIFKKDATSPTLYSPGDRYIVYAPSNMGPADSDDVANLLTTNLATMRSGGPGIIVQILISVRWQMFAIAELENPETDAD